MLLDSCILAAKIVMTKGENGMDDIPNNGLWRQYLYYLLKWVVSYQAHQYAGMSPAGYNEWINSEEKAKEEDMLPECDSEYCAFNPNGYCWVPLLYAHQPRLNDDGCSDFVYRE